MSKGKRDLDPQRAWGDKELRKHCRKNGLTVRNGKGSHFGAYDRQGNRVLTGYYAKEYPTGTRRSIVKMLTAAGFLVLIIMLALLLCV